MYSETQFSGNLAGKVGDGFIFSSGLTVGASAGVTWSPADWGGVLPTAALEAGWAF